MQKLNLNNMKNTQDYLNDYQRKLKQAIINCNQKNETAQDFWYTNVLYYEKKVIMLTAHIISHPIKPKDITTKYSQNPNYQKEYKQQQEANRYLSSRYNTINSGCYQDIY